MSIPRIAIGIPTRDLCAAPFAKCLADMTAHFAANFVATGQAEMTTIFDMGTLLPDMRNSIAKEAIRLGCTHLLWLDNDMTFPVTTLERLYAHGKAIVGASYAKRHEPSKPVAAKNGVWLYTEEDSSGLEEVDFVGTGCMLVETAVFEHLDAPWHMLGWSEQKQDMVGEDVFFCRKARKIGALTFIDHDLTKEIGHIGTRVFTYQDALRDKPILLAQQQAKAAEPKTETV